MMNLYWKSAGKIRSLVEQPFASESNLETYIFENQEILGGDIAIINRQIRTGNRQGIPDMIGVDQDSNICMLELKNLEADEGILTQALNYAIWAETNPDSIKAIWLQSKNKPDDIELDWDNLRIRIILIAPAFKPAVLRMIGKLNDQVDLVEIRRYVDESNEFILVENLVPILQPRVKTTKVLGDWTWEYYESEHSIPATAHFRTAVDNLDALAKQKGWSLPYNLNKDYTGFKLGGRVVFDVAWAGSKAWNVRLKLPPDFGNYFRGEYWEFQRYDNIFSQALFRPLHPENPEVGELEPFVTAAYEFISGRK